MEEKKTTFVFHTEWMQYIKNLENQDVNELLSIICEYVENLKEPKKPNLSDRLLMTWLFIKNQVDKDKTKYDKRCETSKINGKKGGRPKNLKNLKNPEKHDNEYDNDYEYEHEYDDDLLSSTTNIYSFIESNFGRTLSPIEYEEISEWEDSELTRYAIKQAILNGACNIKYISRILESYKNKNIKTVKDAQKDETKFKNKYQKTNLQTTEWLGLDIESEEATEEEIKKLEERMKR